MAVERARRWPPRQRIHLTPEGKTAQAAYQQLVRQARESNLSIAALEASLVEWAGALGIRASDGVLLDELGDRTPSVNELARAVEACGQRGPEVKAGVDRLYGAALIQPPQPAEVAPPPPPSPWRY